MRFGNEKWGGRPFGSSGGTVTWNFTGFSDSFNRFDFIIGGAFRARVRDAFDAWEAVLDIDFRQVGANRNAQIQLGFAEMDGPGGTLG
ncbi:MAG: matrixin family metalloprotease, partial [Pseudomonadota bacterium]